MEWISVEDRLPINGDKALVYNYRLNDIYIAEYENGYFYEFSSELCNITHWMPLPDPPKESTEPEKELTHEDKDFEEKMRKVEAEIKDSLAIWLKQYADDIIRNRLNLKI